MQVLRAIISITPDHLIDRLSTTSREFVRVFLSDNYLSEEVFIRKICGDKWPHTYYTKLKSRTIKALEALAISGPPIGANPIKKKYEICQKKLIVGQKMLSNSHTVGIKFVRKAYAIASEHEFLNLKAEAASILSNYHTFYDPNNKKAKTYRTEAEAALISYQYEKKAEHIYNGVVSKLKKSARPTVLETALNQIQDFPVSSAKAKVIQYIIQITLHFHRAEYARAKKTCTEALATFEKSQALNISQYQFFHTKKGITQMIEGSHTGAALSFCEARQCVQAGDYNDYVLRYYEIIAAIRSGDYQKAHNQWLLNRRCKFERLRNQFAIIEGYLCCLTYLGHIEGKKTFRLSKYLNDTFKAQADKQGDNTSILIAELLIYLVRDKGRFIDRIEAVRHYSYRHLKGEYTRRARWFIEILCTLPSVNFQAEHLQKKCRHLFSKIENEPQSAKDNFSIEILPFNHLLEMVLQHLKKKAA